MNAIPKTFSYRIYSFIILCLVLLLIDGNLEKVFKTSLIIEAVKLAQYYLFEKFWERRKK